MTLCMKLSVHQLGKYPFERQEQVTFLHSFCITKNQLTFIVYWERENQSTTNILKTEKNLNHV